MGEARIKDEAKLRMFPSSGIQESSKDVIGWQG